uniref:Major facilitator superfamily (MFS) profile domain-containing protein n=1 Tax=Lotharella globosa TaxID=91324 RepID=A0A7S3Z0X8_9EUKA|mmetsp:Transcript_21546/g.43262  ORF Transcript_21546/g.43262 Transcript_21546/m.43262 type:complete len:457 (+) Transcript_21546:18-1388(+)
MADELQLELVDSNGIADLKDLGSSDTIGDDPGRFKLGEESTSTAGEEEKYEKKWVKYLLILGTPPPLTSRQWRVFGLLSLAGMFTHYDDTLKSVGVEQIQRSLSISDASISYVIGIVRLGVLLAIFLNLAADRLGRKPLLLITICGFAVMTALTAFSMNVYWFTIAQFFAKMFIHAEYLLSNISILEEFDTGTRGWALGAVSALCVVGSGLCIILYGPLGGYPYGWRILYGIGVVPLIVLAYLRRNLPESRLFRSTQVERGRNYEETHDDNPVEHVTCCQRLERYFRPLKEIQGHYTLLFKASMLLFVYGFCGYPGQFFMFKVLQERYKYSTLEVTAITVGGGLVSIFAYVSAGKLSDRYGRRPILSVVYFLFFAFLITFYNSDGGFFTVASWVIFAASMFGLDVLNSTLVSEIFPTKCRATATTIAVIVGIIGTVAGIFVEGALYAEYRDHWKAV